MGMRSNFETEVANFAARLTDVDSERDALLFSEVLISRRELLRDLSPTPLHRNYWRVLNSLSAISAKAFFTDMKQLRIVVTSKEYRNGTVTFKQLRDVAPIWCIAPLLAFREENDFVKGYAKAIQWVSFDSKVNFRDADYKVECTQEYLDREAAMKQQTYPEDILDQLHLIAVEWFADFSPAAYAPRPHFTNGATATLRRKEATPRSKIADLFFQEQDARYIALRERLDFPEHVPPHTRCTFYDPAMVVDFVPKSPLTNRVISKEPTGRMFLQSDLRDILVDYCKEKGLPFDLHDQETSRRLALRGSVDGRYTTTDLSAASDTVTVSHIRRIFRGLPLLELLLAVRTKYATCDYFGGNRVLELEKFAPMGSNCCFIVETIVFSLVCELAVRRQLGRRGRKGDYRVYGDDMVYLTILDRWITHYLAQLHFTVNTEKSFNDEYGNTYREACGIEAINGVDITPYRISRRYVGACSALSVKKGNHLPDPGPFLGYVDALNRLLCQGLVSTRKFLMEPLCQTAWHRKLWRVSYSQFHSDSERWSRGLPSVGTYKCPTLLTPDCTETNWQLRRRVARSAGPCGYAEDISRIQANCLTIATSSIPDPKDSLDYEIWWMRHPEKDEEKATARLVTPEAPASNSGSSLKWISGFSGI